MPTWHYEAVEIEGEARRLSDDGLVELLDGLSSIYRKASLAGAPWTRAKMEPGTFAAMTKALIGFEVDPADDSRHAQIQPAQDGEGHRCEHEGQHQRRPRGYRR